MAYYNSLGWNRYFLICCLLSFVDCLPECFMDCEMAKMVELQGHNLTADCRCWRACEVFEYSPEARKIVEDYEKVEPKHYKKVLYVRRDCGAAVMASGDFEDIDDLLDKLWDPKGGEMFQKTTEAPGGRSLSAPKDWVLASANYHCPTTKQTPYVIRQLRQYRLKATGGRAVYIHRDCHRVRYSYGFSSPQEAKEKILLSLKKSNQTVNEWFLYDWNLPGFCSPLTHRVRHELRDLAKPDQELLFNAINEAHRRGMYHIHSPYHSQSLMYSYAHGTPGFTMYHRLAILNIEEQLRGLHTKNRCITIPYWHWGRDPDPMKSTFFTPELVGSIENILSQKNCGTNGDGCCVTDGQFAGWTDMYGMCLKRNFVSMPSDKIGLPSTQVVVDLITKYKIFGFAQFGLSIYTSGIVANVLDDCIVQCGDEADEKGTCTPLCHGLISTKKIRGFTGDLELSHNRVHFSVGGHMFASNSPNDPLFLFNHGFVDKTYDRWQRCQGKTDPLYWPTNEEHFADCFTVQGLYGLSDRVLGWTLTIGEAAFGRNMGYTSYEYATDPWEIEYKLATQCSGWDSVVKYEQEKKAHWENRSLLIRQPPTEKLDDTPSKPGTLNPPGLLETQEHVNEKQQLKRRKRFSLLR